VEQLRVIVAQLQEEVKKIQWESLTVPEKIVVLAEEHSVDTSIALNIGCAESQFVPYAQNPTSSAGGVFQWLDSSWAYNSMKYYGYIEDKMDEDRNIELTIWVMRDRGFSDWNASRWSGVGGGWEAKPYERGYCTQYA